MWRAYRLGRVRHIGACAPGCFARMLDSRASIKRLGEKWHVFEADLTEGWLCGRIVSKTRPDGQRGGAHAGHMPATWFCASLCAWCVVTTCTTSAHQAISSLLTSHPQNAHVHLQPLSSTDDCTQVISCGFYRDMFRAATSSRCISPCNVAQIPAACTTVSFSSPYGYLLLWD
jgi:hypothetical protein